LNTDIYATGFPLHLQEGCGNAKELSEKYNKDIQFIRMDASGTSKTASKIKSDAEMKIED